MSEYGDWEDPSEELKRAHLLAMDMGKRIRELERENERLHQIHQEQVDMATKTLRRAEDAEADRDFLAKLCEEGEHVTRAKDEIPGIPKVRAIHIEGYYLHTAIDRTQKWAREKYAVPGSSPKAIVIVLAVEDPERPFPRLSRRKGS